MPPKRVSCWSWITSTSQRQVIRMVRRLLWLTPYMGSTAMRSREALIFSTSRNCRMLSIYSLKG